VEKQGLKARFATIALGQTVDFFVSRAFNYGVYSFVMIELGAFWGTVVIIPLSFLVCLAYMKMYDWIKKDWLGLEFLKEIRENGGEENLFSKILGWALRKGDWLVMIILSMFKDSFYTTAYMRKGANQYNGMSKREWKIFIASLIISCLWWSVWINTGLLFLKYIKPVLVHYFVYFFV
jgi:hypothetical protein